MAIPFIIIELDKPYKLRFGMGAMVEYEQITGNNLITDMSEGLSISAVMDMLFVMMRQLDTEMTKEKMFNLIDECDSGFDFIMTKVINAASTAFSGDQKNVKKSTATKK